MESEPRRYCSVDEDSARWLDFEFRPGDIVISTRSKSGTTWVQMICALLVFELPDLPRPLAELSPWLDWLIVPQSEVYSALANQDHRRFIKTHTPLDGLPLTPEATFIVVARNPLDAALSMYHQSHNLDRRRLAELIGDPRAGEPKHLPQPDVWLRRWIGSQSSAAEDLDSINGVFHHLGDAWARRHADNIVLLHYGDLLADLPGEMRRLADRLGMVIPDAVLIELARAATFESMRSRSGMLAPDAAGVLKDTSSFFREGRSGGGAALLSPADLSAYHDRAARLAEPELLAWLHRN